MCAWSAFDCWICSRRRLSSLFFFNVPPTPEIYTLSLHDALPISVNVHFCRYPLFTPAVPFLFTVRSEEHTSELQSRQYLVCRLLLEKKKSRRNAVSFEADVEYVAVTSRRLLIAIATC